MKASVIIIARPRAHPACANVAGRVNAPVPTIKLNKYMKPVCKKNKKFSRDL